MNGVMHIEGRLVTYRAGRVGRGLRLGAEGVAMLTSHGHRIAAQRLAGKHLDDFVDSSHLNQHPKILGVKVDRAASPALMNSGLVWVVAQLPSAQALLALRPNLIRSAAFERRVGAAGVSLYGAYPSDSLAEIEVRSFLPSSGIAEDPVCGSGNGAIGAFRFVRGLLPSDGATYVASQGQCVGCEGRVLVRVTPQGQVHIGVNASPASMEN